MKITAASYWTVNMKTKKMPVSELIKINYLALKPASKPACLVV
jgi:hypothetical protein